MPYPILFSLFGAITALIVKLIPYGFWQFTLILLAVLLTLIWGRLTKKNLIKSLLAMVVILFGITLWYHYQTSDEYLVRRAYYPLYVGVLIQITMICTAFIQSWKPEKPHFRYSDLFENAWNNIFFVLFGGLLTAGFFSVLALGTQLFDSIGINASTVIWNRSVTPVLFGALAGAGIGISREYNQLIFKVRSVFFAIFRVMAYLAAGIVILFTLTLPFTYSELFANKNTSIILLSVVAMSIFLLNTLVDMGSGKLPVWANWIFRVQLFILPFLALLSVYAISLRIMQYGLMPYRVIAISIAILLSIYGLIYLYQLLKYRSKWSIGFIKTNPMLAILWVILLISLASPVLDPVRLSVNDQVQRLKSGQVAVDKFDFHSLKHKLGMRGKAALLSMRTWNDHPQFGLIEKKLKAVEKTHWYSRAASKEQPPRVASIEIIGDSSKLDELIPTYKTRCYKPSTCLIKEMNITGGAEKEVLVFIFNRNSANKYSFSAVFHRNLNDWWRQKHSYEARSVNGEEMAQIIDDLKHDRQKMIVPIILDIEVGGVQLLRQ